MIPIDVRKLHLLPDEFCAICRIDFLAFAQAAFMFLHPSQKFTFEFCHEAIAIILANIAGKRVRQIINAPPRSLKSFLVSIAWPAFMLGHDPTYRIICASYLQDLANTFSSECRRLMESDFYCRLFSTRLAKAAEDALITTAGGFRIAKSVGSTLTGLGGDALIVDDPLNAKDAGSEAVRAEANKWFTESLIGRLDDKARGVIIVVMQRLHQADLTGHLRDIGGWDLLVLPAIAPRDALIPVWKAVLSVKQGEPLQEREGLDVLDDLKKQMSAQAFNAQYLQDPLPEKGNMLNRDWLRWYDQLPVRQPGDQIIQSWDTAQKTGDTNDYSVCLTFLVRNRNEYYLLDVFRQRLTFPSLCDAVETQVKKHAPNAILIEEHANGIPLIDECRRRGMSVIIARRPTKDKRTRMDGETPKLAAGCFSLPRLAPWLNDFLPEYLSFPGGKHDDQIDALSQFLNWRTEEDKRSIFSVFWP